MRRGFSLFEILVLLPLMVAVAAIIAGLFPVLVRDVPNLQRMTNTYGGLMHMLTRLQQDVDAARSLPDQAAGREANGKRLLLQWPEGTVCYEVKDDEVVKYVLDGKGIQAGPAETWRLPKAKVRFNRWRRSGRAYAVEVQSAVEYATQGHTEEKLANAHVYYLAALPGRKESP